MVSNAIKTFKQAFQLVKGKKSFWLAGLFLVWPNLFISSALIYFAVYKIDWGSRSGSIIYYQSSQVQGNTWIGAVSIIIIATLIILYFRFKAYVPLLTKQVLTKKNVELSKIWQESIKHTWTLVSITMGFLSGLIIFFTLVNVPIVHLIEIGHTERAWILGIIALVLFAPILAVVYLAMVLSPLFNVIYGLNAWDSVRVSLDVIRKLWRGLTAFAGLMTLIQFFGLIISSILVVIVTYPFVFLGGPVYDMGGQVSLTPMQGLAGILGFMVFFMSQAAFSAFSRVAWSVLFFDIIKPVKLEKDPEAEAVPESIPTK